MDYSVSTDVIDAGGGRATSANYSNGGSIGGIEGLSTVVSPAETMKHGYIGQLYDVTGFVVTAGASTVNETSTIQLAGSLVLDDTSLIAVDATSIAWSVVAGPITGISAAGIATAGIVYKNTTATVLGTFSGSGRSLTLTVLDSIPDNFGAYAGDGVGDDWQVQYFGLPPNANAGPNVDFDGTGQTNLFKYLAGLNPLDPTSRFTVKVANVPGQPGQKNIIFKPVVSGRTYTVKEKASLVTPGAWSVTNASAPSDNGTERTVTDLSAAGPLKFYQVEITKP